MNLNNLNKMLKQAIRETKKQTSLIPKKFEFRSCANPFGFEGIWHYYKGLEESCKCKFCEQEIINDFAYFGKKSGEETFFCLSCVTKGPLIEKAAKYIEKRQHAFYTMEGQSDTGLDKRVQVYINEVFGCNRFVLVVEPNRREGST